jgi:glycosidase
MNILGSHDTERILTALCCVKGEDLTPYEKAVFRLKEEEKEIGIGRLRLAYLILATLPGIPTVYYADEVLSEGFSDPYNRMPYAYKKDSGKILDFYRKIGIIRRGESVYKDGDFKLLVLNSSLLSFIRFNKDSVLCTVVNNSDSPLNISSFSTFYSFFTEEKSRSKILLPYSGDILRLRKGMDLSFIRG